MGKDKVKHYTFQIRYFPSCFSYSFLSRCWPEYDWSVLKLDVTTKPINFQYCPIYWNTSERVARKGSTLCNDCSNQINFVPAWFKSSVTFFVWVLLKQGWNWGGESFLLLARRLTRHRHPPRLSVLNEIALSYWPLVLCAVSRIVRYVSQSCPGKDVKYGRDFSCSFLVK